MTKVLFKAHYHQEGPPNDPANRYRADRRDYAILCLVVFVFTLGMLLGRP